MQRRSTLFLMIAACLSAAGWVAAVLAAGPNPPPPAPGELVVGHVYEKPPMQATPLPFDKTDFLNIVRDPVKERITLGQPLEIPFRFVNQTKFKASMLTNLNPRSSLTIKIQQMQPRQGAERQNFGPYKEGNYSPSPVLLYPFEEMQTRILLWSDREMPNGLAFPEPGVYVVKLSVQIGAELSKASGTLNLEPFAVTVDPPADGDQEIIDVLGKSNEFADLQMRKVPEGRITAWEELAAKHPGSGITPFLNYAVGLAYYTQMAAKVEDNALFMKASEYLQKAGSVPSPARIDVLENLAHLYDRVGASDLARQTCEQVISIAPPSLAIRYGSSKLFRKYLVSSAEMDPIKYWDILE